MTEAANWTYLAGEWRRLIGSRILVVRPSETGGWAWQVENTRMRVLDRDEENSLEDAKAAAERRGNIVKTFPCHALLENGQSLEWEMIEDDTPTATDVERSGLMRF